MKESGSEGRDEKEVRKRGERGGDEKEEEMRRWGGRGEGEGGGGCPVELSTRIELYRDEPEVKQQGLVRCKEGSRGGMP